jgi:hypothetical protein
MGGLTKIAAAPFFVNPPPAGVPAGRGYERRLVLVC